jgi:hypothetical protein
MICVPQFEMQPFCPGAAVPGAPVVELETVQNSVVVLSRNQKKHMMMHQDILTHTGPRCHSKR